MAVTKQTSSSESEPKSPVKKRLLGRNSSHRYNEISDSDAPSAKSSTKQSSPTKSKRKSDSFVRFRNTVMISEYKEKNPQITVQNLDEESQFDADEISPDDDVWIFQAPASMDVSQLAGQTFKLGSRSSAVQVGDQSFECVTEKFTEPKGMSLICVQNHPKLALVSFVPEGKVLLRTAINNADDGDAVDFDGLESSVKVPMPDNLKLRHPLHGANYENLIQLDKVTKSKLEEASRGIAKRSAPKEKHRQFDAEDVVRAVSVIKTETTSPKKKSRKRKLSHDDNDEEVPFLPKKAKTKIDTEDGNDLDWIKQL